MNARVTIEGLKEAQQALGDVGDRARRPEPALRASATQLDLQESERRKFARGGWRRATPKWIAEKRRRGLDTRTLRATGLLESALSNATHGVAVTVWNATLTWGIRRGRSDVYYAAALAKGARGMPKRRMVVVDRQAKDRIVARVQRFVGDGDLA